MKHSARLYFLMVVLARSAFAQIEFTQHVLTPRGAATTDNATYVLAADIDGDGDKDIVSASFLDNKVAWYRNDGNKIFAQQIITTNARGAAWLFAADMDGDADVDVLSASAVDDKVAWYENDGSGSFVSHVVDSSQNPTAWLRFSVHASDVDLDGDMDVLSGSWEDTAVKWHENDGSQKFTTHLIANPGQRSHVVVVDLDQDGDRDVLSASQISGTVAWYENDGAQDFTMHVVSSASPFARTVVAVDIDEDGDIDILASLFSGSQRFHWFENDGDQVFTTRLIPESPTDSGSLFVIDVDADGDLDILTATGRRNMIGWLENDGAANFVFHVVSTNAPFANTVYGEDMDGDGDVDVLSSALNGDQIAWYESNLNPPTNVQPRGIAPGEYGLHQNFPNPFNPLTTIEFSLGESATVTLQIFSIAGIPVDTLIDNELRQAGVHRLTFDAIGLPSGAYLMRLTAGTVQLNRKLILLK